jgi:hypothetical protein
MEILVPEVSAFDVEVAVENSVQMQGQSKCKSYFISIVKVHVSALYMSHHQASYQNRCKR